MLVVADSSPLIVLINIGQIDLLPKPFAGTEGDGLNYLLDLKNVTPSGLCCIIP
jgi:hypothetical protein